MKQRAGPFLAQLSWRASLLPAQELSVRPSAGHLIVIKTNVAIAAHRDQTHTNPTKTSCPACAPCERTRCPTEKVRPSSAMLHETVRTPPPPSEWPPPSNEPRKEPMQLAACWLATDQAQVTFFYTNVFVACTRSATTSSPCVIAQV